MPTASTSSTSRRRKAGSKSAAARFNGSTGGASRSKATRSKASRSKATRSRPAGARTARATAANQTASSVRHAGTQWAISDRQTGVDLGDYAERAVLIPVGAALIARDRVISSVNDTISSYSSTSRAQAQLRRFERRGATARNRFERQVRKTRVRVERELRHRRRKIEKTVNELDERRDAVAKNGTELANRVQERLLSLV